MEDKKSELESNSLTFSEENNPNDIKIKETNGILSFQNKNSTVVLGPAGSNNDKSRDNIILYDNEGNQRFNRVWSYIYNEDGTYSKIDLSDKVAKFDQVIKEFTKTNVRTIGPFSDLGPKSVVINEAFEGYIIVSGGYLNEWITGTGGGTIVRIINTRTNMSAPIEVNYSGDGGGDNNPFVVKTGKLGPGTYNISIPQVAWFTNHRSGKYLGSVQAYINWWYTCITFPTTLTED